MFERIRCMFIKEFLQIFRDPKMRSMILIVPILQTLVFGYAVTTDVHNVSIAVYDLDHSTSSRDVVARIVNSGYFYVYRYVDSYKEAVDLINRGDVSVILHFNPDFDARIRAKQTAGLQLILDGTDSNTAGIVLSYLSTIINTYSTNIQLERVSKGNPKLYHDKGIALESRAWFNENLESRNFYVPGIVSILITLITLTLTSMSIVREREIGTMEQMMVTPITRWEFILGKTVPFILIGLMDVIGIIIVAYFWFEVPIRGSLLLLFASVCCYLLTTLGIGLYISTISTTQQQAMMSAFMFYFPITLLSGFIFPIANMPELMQWLTVLNPLKYFLVILRGIFLKGIGIEILWPQIVVLFMMGVFTLWQATRHFHKTMT